MPRLIGRYALYDALGQGAMGAVSIGVARGADRGRPTLIAAKELLPSLERDPARHAMLFDEMRLTRLAQHPNVVAVRDLVYDGEAMVLVMDYVHGESLRRLLASSLRQARATDQGEGIPLRIAAAIARDLCRALEAAHGARDEKDQVLGLVHRDVTPENVLVDAEGVVRLADFGVAKAEGRIHATRGDGVKGKLPYLAPEQVGGEVTARTDIYAAGLVLWEMLAGRRALRGENEAHLLVQVLSPSIPAPSTVAPTTPSTLDDVVARAIAPVPGDRFASAAELGAAIELAVGPDGIAGPREVAAWVDALVGDRLAERRATIDRMLAAEAESDVPTQDMFPSGSTVPVVAPVFASANAPGKRKLGWVAGIAVAASFAFVVSTAFAVRAHVTAPAARAAAATEETAATATTATAMATTATTATPIAIANTITAATVPAAPVVATFEPAPETPAPGASASPRSAKRKAAPSPPPQAPQHARAACDPPYVVDAKGIVVYKNECLK